MNIIKFFRNKYSQWKRNREYKRKLKQLKERDPFTYKNFQLFIRYSIIMADFTGNKIKDTYARVVQYHNGTLKDGLGFAISASARDR